MKIKDIQKFINNFYTPFIIHKKCWQCKYFVKNGGKGSNGCTLDPFSFDNNWEYIPETYKANDNACYDFKFKSDIIKHLEMLSEKNAINKEDILKICSLLEESARKQRDVKTQQEDLLIRTEAFIRYFSLYQPSKEKDKLERLKQWSGILRTNLGYLR